MKSLTASQIKKILFGVILTDGHVDTKNCRFEFYSKSKQLSDTVTEVLHNITGMHVNYKYDLKNDGHRIWTRKHAYWDNLKRQFYTNRKHLNKYNVSRLNEVSFAYMWMCNGYLEHAKNRKLDKVQNIGWFCLEAFPKEELEIFQDRLLEFGIGSSLVKKPWGFGYRIRIGGDNLQKFISLIYPHILDDFKYKTVLFYKSEKNVDTNLSSAEHIFKYYEGVDDIVRYSEKLEKTNG